MVEDVRPETGLFIAKTRGMGRLHSCRIQKLDIAPTLHPQRGHRIIVAGD